MGYETISKLITEGQIERVHNLLDHGYIDLLKEDIQLLDNILDTFLTAIHRNSAIRLKATDRIEVDNIVYIDRYKSSLLKGASV